MIPAGSKVVRAVDVSKEGVIQWVDEDDQPVLLPTTALKPYDKITRDDMIQRPVSLKSSTYNELTPDEATGGEMNGIELVMLGAIWRDLSVDVKQALLPYVRVFARTNPDDKVRRSRAHTFLSRVSRWCGGSCKSSSSSSKTA
jgi:hypothetical protein